MGLCSIVTIVALTSMAPDDPGFKNVKVLPKTLTDQQLHQVMREWAVSLGVRCDFCHAADPAGKGLDFASDAKPEKEMARHMFKMMSKINAKYFKAEKDSLGMMAKTGINCYTCHRGSSHPEVKLPEMRRGPAPAPGVPPPGGTPPGSTPPDGAPPKQ